MIRRELLARALVRHWRQKGLSTELLERRCDEAAARGYPLLAASAGRALEILRRKASA